MWHEFFKWCQVWTHKCHWLLLALSLENLGDGFNFQNIFIFTPPPPIWGNDSNLTIIFFKWVGEKPRTRNILQALSGCWDLSNIDGPEGRWYMETRWDTLLSNMSQDKNWLVCFKFKFQCVKNHCLFSSEFKLKITYLFLSGWGLMPLSACITYFFWLAIFSRICIYIYTHIGSPLPQDLYIIYICFFLHTLLARMLCTPFVLADCVADN